MLPLTKENLTKLNDIMGDQPYDVADHLHENLNATRSLSSISVSDEDEDDEEEDNNEFYFYYCYDENQRSHHYQQQPRQKRASTWSAGSAKKFLARHGSRLVYNNTYRTSAGEDVNSSRGFWTKMFGKNKRQSKRQEHQHNITRLSGTAPVWYSQFTVNPPPPSPDLVSTYSSSPSRA
ncbi:hypothetical protein INT45_009554 [Circinella minor]|uniref:Uncharacterized protein n=1 Tax=Circinella minor TaxID=1195481 RepID=A0A8H7SAR7_9FUNG|nr:hypothetical protein INT45_009554 [Circinella minor]